MSRHVALVGRSSILSRSSKAVGMIEEKAMLVYPWREHEITLTAERAYPNPYTDVDVWGQFTHDTGVTLHLSLIHI